VANRASTSLRARLVRLAKVNPNLRPHLLPLLWADGRSKRASLISDRVREAFESEMLPEVLRMAETQPLREVRDHFSKELDLAFTSKAPTYLKLINYQSTYETDVAFLNNLKRAMDEWIMDRLMGRRATL